jgi:hypothetical protein
MSLVDEVLVNHSDNAGSTFCYWCDGEWPCESVRLALSLRAAEQVVEAAREMLSESFIVGGGTTARRKADCRGPSSALWAVCLRLAS